MFAMKQYLKYTNTYFLHVHKVQGLIPIRLKNRKIKSILIANRGEVAIRICRACTEMGIKSVAIYSDEDKTQMYRQKADESYMIGRGQRSVKAYLNIAEIIRIAIETKVDAIHPGIGFLSERDDFAQAVIDAGMTFIGPKPAVLRTLGDKITARKAAIEAGVPIIPGTSEPVASVDKVVEFCSKFGLPVILKAAYGGGGRGMRILNQMDSIVENYERACSEAKASFGNDSMFLEKYIDRPRHIEVQIIGDLMGNVIHLFERDCSIQRRYQKVIQIAPAQNLDSIVRNKITELSVKLAKHVGYSTIGTVEFLCDEQGRFYFIEVNPRLQVEHTLTEEITGVDLVQSQIKVSQGLTLKELGLTQNNIFTSGCAIQCHVRTEDPSKDFKPDTGIIEVYRSSEGPGVRVDGSCPYPRLRISNDFDSLLVKVISHSPSFTSSREKMIRALKEFRIRGVITNISFLLNVFNCPEFLKGSVNTGYIDGNPQLFSVDPQLNRNRAQKLLHYFGDVLINAGPSAIEKYARFKKENDYIKKLPESIFLNGPNIGEEIEIEFEKGKIAYIKALAISNIVDDKTGAREVFFDYNGQLRSVLIIDKKESNKLKVHRKSNKNIEEEIGAPLPGTVVDVFVKIGDKVRKEDPLIVLSAMKTEVLIQAPVDGVVKQILIGIDSKVEENDLVIILE